MTKYQLRSDVVSWGRTLRAMHKVARPSFRDELFELMLEGRNDPNCFLAIGLRRSYGDSGLNAEGSVIDMTGVSRFIDFDENTGLLIAESGAALSEILELVIPRGYFLPVTPGTRHVTLGGAVANDVHGKNHHSSGTFGRWVREIGLLRSDGTQHNLRPDDDTGLFHATIGGMGLTGIITHVALQLKPITSSLVHVETLKIDNLSEFFTLASESAHKYEYTVAWIDCLAKDDSKGRGIFTRANHASEGPLVTGGYPFTPTVPVEVPGFALNRFSISAFNSFYYAFGKRKHGNSSLMPYGPYFYPLDAIVNWNKLYGKYGMYQYQSIVPPETDRDATADMLNEIARAGQGSFLAVLKTFGALKSPGLMSFPREGTTLALDFPNRGAETLALLDRLDAIIQQAGGRLYPAKDARIPPKMFRTGYPEQETFKAHIDPCISSSFWRRVQS